MDELEKDLIKHFARHFIEVDSFHDRLKLNWMNRAAALLANRLYNMIGRTDTVMKDRKGFAKWKNLPSMFHESDKTYEELIVADVISHIHFVPTTHMDYILMSIEIDLNDETVEHLSKISDSLKYANGMLTANSDFPGAIIAKFAVVRRVNEGKLNIADARDTYRVWLKICYDEWCDILEGREIEDATLTQVLEKYIFS